MCDNTYTLISLGFLAWHAPCISRGMGIFLITLCLESILGIILVMRTSTYKVRGVR